MSDRHIRVGVVAAFANRYKVIQMKRVARYWPSADVTPTPVPLVDDLPVNRFDRSTNSYSTTRIPLEPLFWMRFGVRASFRAPRRCMLLI